MDISSQADALAQKIKHMIITGSGHTYESASADEFYQAFCATLREEMMINWTATMEAIEKKKTRILSFLSMEYLPGRLLTNTLVNIGAMDLIKAVLNRLNRPLCDLSVHEPDPGLGHGGLGRLASCFLDSLATMQYPARGYGLRYQYGIFEQEIWDGKQVERPDCWLLNVNPWEVRRDIYSVPIRFHGHLQTAQNRYGESVYGVEGAEEIRALPYDMPIVGYLPSPNYSVITLRLWSTKESPRNFLLQRYNAGLLGAAAENASLTDVLYPNDNTEMGKRIRLKQEYLLAAASLKDIIRRHLSIYGDMSAFADKARIQINDAHPALVVAEIVRLLTENYDYSFDSALEACQEVCNYTNHTILREGLEEWKEKRMAELLPRQYAIIQRINQHLCDEVRARTNDEEKVRRLSIIERGQIRMAHLAIFGSHKVNGVAKLHSEILKKKLFRDFYDLFPDKFTNVTNGISQRRWLLHANPRLAAFITERIGFGWVADFNELKKMAPFASDPATQEEFLLIKRKNKEDLLAYLKRENPVRNKEGKIISHSPILGVEALFDVQIKRFHEYKRQLLNLLHLIMLYYEISEGTQRIPRLSIFAGKAAPGYERAKQILQLTCALSRRFNQNPAIRDHLQISFVENYNVTRAELIVPAADLSEQISAAGWEASGTGNMKLTLNGALTIGTEDGSTIELHQAVGNKWWPFAFGINASQMEEGYNSWDFYNQDEGIRRALDALRDGVFAENDDERHAFGMIYQNVLENDTYRILRDLRSYYDAQRKVESFYQQPQKWAEMALRNLSAMSPFSTDYSIRKYATEIWGIEPCPPDQDTLKFVRDEYSAHDRCKIG